MNPLKNSNDITKYKKKSSPETTKFFLRRHFFINIPFTRLCSNTCPKNAFIVKSKKHMRGYHRLQTATGRESSYI